MESPTPVLWLKSLTTSVTSSPFRCIPSNQGDSPLSVKQYVGHFHIGVISAIVPVLTPYMVTTDNLKNSYYVLFLGCSYRASCVRIAIRLPTDATVYFVCLSPLFLPYIFRALISPSSRVHQAVFYIQPFCSCGVYVAHLRVPVDWFVVVVSLYWCRGGSPVLVY